MTVAIAPSEGLAWTVQALCHSANAAAMKTMGYMLKPSQGVKVITGYNGADPVYYNVPDGTPGIVSKDGPGNDCLDGTITYIYDIPRKLSDGTWQVEVLPGVPINVPGVTIRAV